MATLAQLTAERQELENKVFADRIKLSQLKEGLTDRVWKGWYHLGRLQAIDSEGYYRDCGWSWGPGPEYPQDCYRNWKVNIAKDGVLEGESCKAYPLGSIGRGRLKNACGRNGSCHGGYFKCTAQPSATQSQISALESEINASAKRIAELDDQILDLRLQEQLSDQFNVLRDEADAKVAAIRVESERIIAEIRADYAQRDENVRAEAAAKIQAARDEADAKIEAVRQEKARQLLSLVEQINQALDPTGVDAQITIEAIEAMTTEEIEALTVKYSALIADYKTDADKKIVDYQAQTDAEVARIKAEADAEIERVKAEAEAKMETLRREAGVVPTIAPELAKWLPLLLIGGYLAVTGKPKETLAKRS